MTCEPRAEKRPLALDGAEAAGNRQSPRSYPRPGNAAMPPCDLDAERAVLGCCLLPHDGNGPTALEQARGIVDSAEAFTTFQHRALWAVLIELAQAGTPCDFVTAKAALMSRGAFATDAAVDAFLVGLAESFPTAAHVKHYAGIVARMHRRRAVMAAAERTYEAAASDRDPGDAAFLAATDNLVQTVQNSIPAYKEVVAGIEFPRPVRITELDGATGNEVPWLWRGWLARGHTALLTALWKAGKSTLLSHLCKAFCTGGDLAGRVEPARILIVSEESALLWRRRRDKIGLSDNVSLICRPFMAKPDDRTWAAFLSHVAGAGADLVVFDTVGSCWPVVKENDAGEVLAALSPMHVITDAGAALLMIHHNRKGDGTEAQASRGSGAITGFVDCIIELRRFNPGDPSDRRRTLTGYGRFEETPGETVIELADDGYGYRTLGNKADAVRSSRLAATLAILPDAPPGLDAAAIRAAWPNGNAPGIRTLRYDLGQWVRAGFLASSGAGAKGDPLRYWKNSLQDSIPATKVVYAGIESSAETAPATDDHPATCEGDPTPGPQPVCSHRTGKRRRVSL